MFALFLFDAAGRYAAAGIDALPAEPTTRPAEKNADLCVALRLCASALRQRIFDMKLRDWGFGIGD